MEKPRDRYAAIIPRKWGKDGDKSSHRPVASCTTVTPTTPYRHPRTIHPSPPQSVERGRPSSTGAQHRHSGRTAGIQTPRTVNSPVQRCLDLNRRRTPPATPATAGVQSVCLPRDSSMRQNRHPWRRPASRVIKRCRDYPTPFCFPLGAARRHLPEPWAGFLHRR